MSEPSQPRPRPSSTAAIAGDNPKSDEDGIEAGPAKLSGDLTPQKTNETLDSVEVKVENKQKRKRTSAHDQSILEAEYKRNSKPNKSIRAEIVKLVALNEKEVQIWFQNRRQIDRRKSRPLLPHEVAALGIGSVPFSSDPASDATICSFSAMGELPSSSQTAPSSSQEEMKLQEQAASSSSLQQEHQSQGTTGSKAVTIPKDTVETTKLPGPPSLLRFPSQTESTQSPENSFNISDSVVQSFTSTPGYLANRWNSISNSQFTPPASQNIPFTPQISHYRAHPSSCPERIGVGRPTTPPPSQVRLSMSLEGKAELVSTVASPVRLKSARPSSESILSHKRRRGLHRSLSAIPFGPVSKQPPTGGSLVPHLLSGRSRDARTWELCCDTEARDELTKQAENESNGSAVAAISLLRSTSNSVLKSNPQKRNVPPAKNNSGWTKRQKLERSQSSLARLQTSDTVSLKPSQSAPDGTKSNISRSPSGDSDKENRIPYEFNGNPRRRPLPSSRTDKRGGSKRILEDNHNIPPHTTGFGGEKKKRRGSYDEPVVFEDNENEEVPEDVERFMRGEISPSKKGDLDCVQGLLSLSQGNWR